MPHWFFFLIEFWYAKKLGKWRIPQYNDCSN
jgi:hypothetical protein